MNVGSVIIESITAEFADLGDVGAATKIAFRLLLAALLGGCLGYERESKGKAAGIRTHMLVAAGAALFIMAPALASFDKADLSRIIQGLAAGIGFLGAGAIVKGRPGEEIEGLTTAASIWMTAAIGMTVGLGRAATAVLAAVLALVVLAVMFRAVEKPGAAGSAHRPPRGD